MAKITLKPLDDGQRAVEIPVGKTTIGRGPFLGCSDKKVSRNHAVLEVTNKGEVFLTPTHVNPCFYQPTADSPGQILKKDIPHKLENGDSFSLLPRAFRYQLIVTGENDEKKDQNDLNKQTGKTNGAAGEGEEAILNERNKESKNGKGLSSEDLNDANITEKAFSKDDDILANIDKNYSKEDNTFAKKIADIDDSKSLNVKDSKEMKEDKNSDKDKSDTNSSSKQETNKEESHDILDSDKNKDETNESKISETCAEDKTDDKQKFSEKVIEENESTLGNDAFSKEKCENDHLQSSDKSESKSIQDKSETKKSDNVRASNGDEILDSVISDCCDSFAKGLPNHADKNEARLEVGNRNFDDTIIANTSYLLETYEEYDSREKVTNNEILMNLSRECNDELDLEVCEIDMREHSKTDACRHYKQSPVAISEQHHMQHEKIIEIDNLCRELIEAAGKCLENETEGIPNKKQNVISNLENIEETLEEHIINFNQNISDSLSTVVEVSFSSFNGASISNIDEKRSTKSNKHCISLNQGKTALHPEETTDFTAKNAMSGIPPLFNMEDTDDENSCTSIPTVQLGQKSNAEVVLSSEPLKCAAGPQNTLTIKSRKRKHSENRENSELRELINTNKKIEENLLKISEEIKRRNDLQEEVVQLKRKKLKLMCLSANVNEDSLK